MSENDWKAFAEQRRAAAKAERELARRDPMPRELVISLSLEMLNLYESLHGDPFIKDATFASDGPIAADDKLLKALAALQQALDDAGAPWMIIGGIAVIGRGVPRDKSDVDAVVDCHRPDCLA